MNKSLFTFRLCPFVNQVQYMNERLYYSPYRWHLSQGLRLTDRGCLVSVPVHKTPLHQFFFFSRKHSKELFTGAEVVLNPFCFLLDILIVLVNNHLTSLTRCTWTASTWGWCSWTAVPGRAACRRTGCGGKTRDTTTCSNGTWNPSGHVLGGRRPGSEGLRAGSAAPFHTILSPLSLVGFLFLSVVTLSNMYACPHRSKKKQTKTSTTCFKTRFKSTQFFNQLLQHF